MVQPPTRLNTNHHSWWIFQGSPCDRFQGPPSNARIHGFFLKRPIDLLPFILLVHTNHTKVLLKSRTDMIPSVKLTASLHLKMDAWNTFSFPFGALCLFSGAFAVSFREGTTTMVFMYFSCSWSSGYVVLFVCCSVSSQNFIIYYNIHFKWCFSWISFDPI